jgi:hypothetical protein
MGGSLVLASQEEYGAKQLGFLNSKVFRSAIVSLNSLPIDVYIVECGV